MTQRVLCTTFAIAFLFIATSVQAQSGFAKFKQRLDDLKPKGTLIKQIFQIEDPQPKPRQLSIRQPKPPAQIGQHRLPRSSTATSNRNPATAKQQPIQLAPASQTRFPKNQTPAKPVKQVSIRKPKPLTDAPLTSPKQVTSVAKENISNLGASFKQTSQGILIVDVATTSSAGKAGLEQDDLLLSLAGMKIKDTADLFEIAGALSDGDQIEIVVQRAGKQKDMLLVVGSPANNTSPDQQAAVLATDDSEITTLRATVERQKQVIAELQKKIQDTHRAQTKTNRRTAASEIPLAN